MDQVFPPSLSVDLSSEVAVVTGATSGLGRRFALLLASSGASVAAIGRRADRLGQLATEIAALGGTCAEIQFDVTDDDALVPAIDEAERQLGPISVLVNNAGRPDAQYATKMSTRLIDDVIATNLRGPFLLSCEVARRLIARRMAGRIVNISSMSAFRYDGNAAALYSITKAALNRMTETLAVEWARFHINVNAIAPGVFSSEMTDAMTERLGPLWERFPRERLGNPTQLDSTLLYLLAPSSELVTGTIIKVDDGQYWR
jgi:NAD(P)-dependent dehydrogenase (short-subunit alcohol dehydrogenase family)